MENKLMLFCSANKFIELANFISRVSEEFYFN